MFSRVRALAVVAGAAYLALLPARAKGQTLALWNSGAGNWTDAAGWSSNPNFPNSASYGAVIFGPSNVNLNSDITVGSFTLADGTLSGNSQLNVMNNFTWSNGTFSGQGQINVYNSMTIDGQTHGLAGYTFNILPGAIADWTGWIIFPEVGEGGGANNYGYFNDRTAGGWFRGSSQTPVFNNYGLYLKLAGAVDETKLMELQFNNTGQVDIQEGNLWFAGGGFNTGSFTVAEGKRLAFSDFSEIYGSNGATPTTFTETSSIMSLGELTFAHSNPQTDWTAPNSTTEFPGMLDSTLTRFNTGELGRVHFAPGALLGTNFTGDIEILGGTIVYDTGMTDGIIINNGLQKDGRLQGTDNLHFQTFTWSGGFIEGGVGSQMDVSGSLTTNGNTLHVLSGRTLIVDPLAQAKVSAGSFHLSSGTIRNLKNPTFGTVGTFDLQSDVLFTNVGTVGTTSAFYNDGYFKKSGGTGSSVFNGVEFHNTGTVNVQSGALRLAGGGTHTGTFIIASNSALDLAGLPTHTFAASSSITGPAGSTLRFTDNQSILQANVNVGSLELHGNSDVVVPAGAGKTLQVASVWTDLVGGSELDLNDNTLIVGYSSSPLASIRQQLQSAFNNGSWNGNGITSSMASTTHGLSYVDSPTTLVGPGTITIELALFGDANLDGSVNMTDLMALGDHWQAAADWSGGDYDYNGFVDVNDELTLLPNWPGGIDSLNSALASLNLPPVPEPTVGFAVLMLTWPLLRRRNRRF